MKERPAAKPGAIEVVPEKRRSEAGTQRSDAGKPAIFRSLKKGYITFGLRRKGIFGGPGIVAAPPWPDYILTK